MQYSHSTKCAMLLRISDYTEPPWEFTPYLTRKPKAITAVKRLSWRHYFRSEWLTLYNNTKWRKTYTAGLEKINIFPCKLTEINYTFVPIPFFLRINFALNTLCIRNHNRELVLNFLSPRLVKYQIKSRFR